MKLRRSTQEQSRAGFPAVAVDAVGGKIRVGDVEGVAAGVAPDGCLRVRTADGEVAVSAGSVERIGS